MGNARRWSATRATTRHRRARDDGGQAPHVVYAPRVILLAVALTLLLLTACGQRVRMGVVDLLQAPSLGSTPAMRQSLAAQNQRAATLRQGAFLNAAVNSYLAGMSLDDELGQMLLNRCACGAGTYSADLATMVQQQHVGGFIFYADNFNTLASTRALIQQVQAHAALPLFIGTDQEGGDVNRIGKFFGYFPGAQDLGSSGNAPSAYSDGARTAQDLLQLGINADFAPVVDIPLGGDSWIGYRTFSGDPKVVARLAGAYVSGLQDNGVMACLKHFPGIGSITQDPHATLPVINRTLIQFQQTEFYPYQQIIPTMNGMIMATDVLAPLIDPTYPAELSPTWINGILRQQLGFNGVVSTDAIWMDGITQHWSIPEASVLAVLAGDDIIEGAANAAMSQQILDALNAAVASGRITRARIDQSVRRIIALKIAYGMLPIPTQLQTIKVQFGSIPQRPSDFRLPHLVNPE
jgi:beta-N-acetylhexosaminidase